VTGAQIVDPDHLGRDEPVDDFDERRQLVGRQRFVDQPPRRLVEDPHGGTSDLRTDASAIVEAIRSISEWIASERIPTEPVISPAASLSAIRALLEQTPTIAARAFAPLLVPPLPPIAATISSRVWVGPSRERARGDPRAEQWTGRGSPGGPCSPVSRGDRPAYLALGSARSSRGDAPGRCHSAR
jgi:hypothetical protein